MLVSPVMVVLVGFVGALMLITGTYLVQCGLRASGRQVESR